MAGPTARSDLPNIILVVFDTARWDRFGCYGYDKPTTPTVDDLAGQGLRIETMITNGPYTLPSHGSLFTGLYPTEHGSQWKTGPRLRDSVEITMAEFLRDLGYHTVCATNNGLISERTGLARGFEERVFRLDLERGWRRGLRRAGKVLRGGDSGGEIVNSWIEDNVPRFRRPFFLFVNYLECHWSYVPPPRLVRRVGGPRFRPLEGIRYRAGVAFQAGPWEAIARADERTLQIYSTLYDGELAQADEHLSHLLDAVNADDGHTIVLVTSDHGEHLGEHGLADHHASLDDHLIRVPFVAWGPGIVPRADHGAIHEFVDVLPSLARLLGSAPPARYLNGRRTTLFTPADAGTQPREIAFSEWRSWSEKEVRRLAARNPSYDFTGLARDLLCARDDRFKLVRSSNGVEELFDLHEDPLEEKDASREHPDALSRLSDELDASAAAWDEWDTGASALSDKDQREIEQRLADLGYI